MSNASKYLELLNSKYIIILPSGIEFKIRRPNSFWFAANVQSLPIGLPSEAVAAASETIQTSETETARNAKLTRKLVIDHVLDPKIVDGTPNYEAGELSIDDLLPEDAKFIVEYLMGIVGATGEPVEPFLKQSMASDAGAN